MNSHHTTISILCVCALAAVAAVVLLAGCGTIMHGSKQNIGFSSAPTGATIWVNNQTFGITPAIVDLSRKDNHVVRIELDNYQPYEATITRSVSGWVWGNIVFGGLIGLAVDAISGGLYKLSPEQVEAQLAVSTAEVVNENGSLFVVVVLEPSPNWEEIGTLTKE